MKIKAKAIDDYLSLLDNDKRKALERLRTIIKKAAPDAEECISYQLPAFRLNGKMLAWFGAGANHCSFYPGGIVEQYKEDLQGFSISKGTIRFQPEHPLPAGLITKIIKAKIAAQKAARPKKFRKTK